MTRSRLSPCLVALLLVSALLLIPSRSQAGEEGQKSMAFLPFTIHAGQDLSYLREGIRDMLASRLAADAGVAVVDKARVEKAVEGKGNLDPQALLDIGRSLGADYLVTGSFTSLGGGVSLDASVYQPAHPGPPQRFYVTAETQGEVIRAIDQLAWNLAAKLFQVQMPAQFRPAAAATAPGPQNEGPAPFQTAHPERAFIVPAAPAASGVLPASGTGNNQGLFIRPQTSAVGFTTTRNFDFGLQAFDAGDVDGDGAAELVLADRSTVYVYHQQGGRLNEMARVPVSGGATVHWLSIADVDGDGRSEIYISAATAEAPSSLAVEWDGKGFASLFKGARWYIRAMKLPGQGTVLLGQRPAVEGVLLPGLYLLSRNDRNHSLQKGEQLSLPDWVNLFDFNLADVNGDGEPEIIHITQEDQLQVARRDGKVIWRSDDDFGGTTRFLGGEPLLGAYKESARYSETGKIDSKRFYLPSRILVADLNGDKIPDIIVNKNKPLGTKVLKNLRSYTSGELYGLFWNGIGMAELWHTRKIDGYIVDYQLQRGGGQDLLQVGLELGSGFLSDLTGRESTVLIFPLDGGGNAKKK